MDLHAGDNITPQNVYNFFAESKLITPQMKIKQPIQVKYPKKGKPILIVEFIKLEDTQQVLAKRSCLSLYAGFKHIFIREWLRQ